MQHARIAQERGFWKKVWLNGRVEWVWSQDDDPHGGLVVAL